MTYMGSFQYIWFPGFSCLFLFFLPVCILKVEYIVYITKSLLLLLFNVANGRLLFFRKKTSLCEFLSLFSSLQARILWFELFQKMYFPNIWVEMPETMFLYETNLQFFLGMHEWFWAWTWRWNIFSIWQ